MLLPIETPLVFAAWGFEDGREYDLDPWKLTNKVKLYDFKTVAVELGHVKREHVKYMQDLGIKVVAWNVVDSQSGPALDALGVDAFMPQIEGPGQYDGCLAALKAGVGKNLPKAIVTTFSGIEGGQYAKLQALGVSACFVECYRSDALTHADLDAMKWQSTQYGIPAGDFVPTCGTYNQELPPSYTGLDKVGREFGVYLAEPMLDDTWKAWGGVNMSATKLVYYWRLMAGASKLHEERAITNPDGTNGLSKMLDWMDAHKDTIRTAGDVQLKRILA